MKKNIFAHVVVSIELLLLLCFALVIINNFTLQWDIKDSLHVLSPTNNNNDTVQQFKPIKSFVFSDILNRNNINNDYITASLENLHSKFFYQQNSDDTLELEVLHANANFLYYKVFDQNETWTVAIYHPQDSAPLIAVVNKEQAK